MSDKIKLIVLSSLSFGIIYFSISLRRDKATRIIENPVGTVATVLSVGWKTIEVEYSLNGKRYIYTENIPIDGITVGDQFVAFAQRDNFENVLVYYDSPVLDSSKFEFRSVIPTEVEMPLLQTDYLRFSYRVNGKSYSRAQKYYIPEKRPTRDDKVVVWYQVKNPQVAYLIKRKDQSIK